MNYQKTIQQIENQLQNYLGNKKAVIGISGGIDSAVVATLCARALGKENVWGISMPYANQSTRDTEILVNQLGIKNKKVNIEQIVNRFNFLNLNKLSKGNIMARTRMNILYTFTNELNGLVIGTSNKSEIEIGYFTKYGDGGVDLEPIGDIYKTEIFDIAKILNLPQSIIQKKPSAELWDEQTDEDELGITYKQLDAVLKGEINQGEIYEKVQKFKKSSEHKRKTPPVFKINNTK